jgi:hypothetical protein
MVFSIPHELAKDTLIDIAYVGNRANRLLTFANLDEALPNKPGQSLTLAQRQNTRPFPNYGDITYAWNGAFSDYESLQARFEYRFSSGLFFLNSFTWSKAIDNASNAGPDIARSDPFWQLDASLDKNFRLPWERMRPQFRAEVFNVLNRTNFQPTGGFNCSTFNSTPGACTLGSFGTITSTFDLRLIQLWLKLSF